jgi:hypothetical protein
MWCDVNSSDICYYLLLFSLLCFIIFIVLKSVNNNTHNKLQIGGSSRNEVDKSKFIYVSYEVVMISPASAKVKKTWSYTFTLPHAFMA